jgi:hypothetical protein
MIARSVSGTGTDFDTDVPMELFAVDRRPIDVAVRSVLA